MASLDMNFQFTINSMILLSDMKTKLRHTVATLYQFDRNHTAESISYNADHAKELLTKMSFIYPVRPLHSLFAVR